MLGHRARRDVHRPGAVRLQFRASAVLPQVFVTDDTVVVHDPGVLVAETASASQGPDTSTITLPAVAARLRAYATGRFAHQPLGPGAPTVVESAPVE